MNDTISVTLKLYASLGSYLPPGTARNAALVETALGATIEQLLDAHHVPREACHLVLLNGVFQPRERRASTTLSEGDAVAVWPPVAGG
ncbi:MAG: molybdopterin synthase sulfur carrier subunit [Alphaproteobacteria bacterium BRH_c36]|nr:MAG: molybdopterin synthase sulfur carrier subunit [Alphaproteobacteria bacterium BRH_c36]